MDRYECGQLRFVFDDYDQRLGLREWRSLGWHILLLSCIGAKVLLVNPRADVGRDRSRPRKLLEGVRRAVSLGRVSEKAPLLMLGLPKGSLEESTKNLFAKAGWK
ncbi:MAG: hypothetical protein ABL994_22325, partial [Verrucomicrobiales bacterium]